MPGPPTGQVTVGVADLQAAVRFYDPVLATIGFTRDWSNDTGASYGRIGTDDKVVLAGHAAAVFRGSDVAPFRLNALNRTSVEAFHLAGQAHNARASGGPSLVMLNGTSAAVVVDPDGNALEAVYAAQPITHQAATAQSGALSMPAVPATPPRHMPSKRPDGEAPLLDIQGLKTHFKTDDGFVKSVDGVDISIHRGETVGIVGESGCGKTVTAMSVLKLIPMPPGRIAAGKILWQGRDLVPLSHKEMDEIRAKEIAIIFQEPMTSLNPVYTVGDQITEVLLRHEGMNKKQALDRTVELLSLVQIPNPGRRVEDYPHQFSGGMRQRVMIAMALACNPKLLIADEPTTALDVTIQAQILELMQDLKDRLGMSIMLITHAMGVVAEVTQRVVVMYAGRVVEEATVEELFANPRHPYTQGLIRSIPRIDLAAAKKQRLEAISGTVPNLLHPPAGCRFAARCKFAKPECIEAQPPLKIVAPGHKVACIL